jgi:membrane-associated protease RseP (regulator of RpoE activity)
MKTKTPVILLLCAFLLTFGLSAVADDDDDNVERNVLIERFHGGDHEDCEKIIEFTGDEGGAFAMAMGSRGFLGVELNPLTPELLQHFGVADEHGVLLAKVEDDSPAFTAGLEVGDIITRIDGEEVTSPSNLSRLVRDREEGDVVDVEYYRDRKIGTSSVTLAERQRCGFDINAVLDINMEGMQFDFSGMEDFPQLMELNGEAMGEAMRHLEEVMESGALKGHLQKLENIDLHEIEERLEQVHERLRNLEGEIHEEKHNTIKEEDGEVF